MITTTKELICRLENNAVENNLALLLSLEKKLYKYLPDNIFRSGVSSLSSGNILHHLWRNCGHKILKFQVVNVNIIFYSFRLFKMSALLTKLVCIQVYFTAAFCKDDIPSQRRSRLLIFDDRPNQTVVLSRIVPAQTDRQGSQPERMILSWWGWSWAMQALRNGLRLGGRQLDNEGNPQQAELENERSWFKENTQEVLCYGKPNECCNINDIVFYFQSPTDSYF